MSIDPGNWVRFSGERGKGGGGEDEIRRLTSLQCFMTKHVTWQREVRFPEKF